MNTTTHWFLGRQPILDRHQEIVAYELLFRNSEVNAAAITDHARATATVIANAFSEFSVGDALGDCRGFINVDEDILFSDILELLPRQSVVLEILETVKITPAVVDRCRALRNSGYTLALDDVVQLGDEFRPLIDLIDIVKVDVQPIDRRRLTDLATTIHDLGCLGLAEKVDSQAQMEICRNLGFDLFQGYYFARPVIITGRKLEAAQLTLLNLLNQVLAEADDREIEKTLKQAPGLTLNLLRLTNSVGIGAPTRVSTVRQAIRVLGRRQLQRWLQLLLYTVDGEAAGSSPLLNLAATRGRLLELLAATLAPGEPALADRAFLCGILSLTPALLHVPLADVVSRLKLDADSLAALRAPGERSGRLGALLSLAEQLEADDAKVATETLAGLPGLDVATVNRCLAQALAWAGRIGREA